MDGVDRALGAVGAIVLPATLCTVTTAQGFASLVVSDIPAVEQSGIFAAVGTVIAFVLGLGASADTVGGEVCMACAGVPLRLP